MNWYPGGPTADITFKQIKSLIESDFFTLVQIRTILKSLHRNKDGHEQFSLQNLNLSKEQIKTLQNTGMNNE